MIPSNDLIVTRDPALQITILRTVIANLERYLTEISDSDTLESTLKFIEQERDRLNKYRNQYPEYFV